MSLTVATALSIIPEPLKGLGLMVGGYFGKALVDMFKTRKIEQRNDFIAITNVLQAQVQLLSERVDKSDQLLAVSKQETERCEERYNQLTNQYNDLTDKYHQVVTKNNALEQEVGALKAQFEQHAAKEQ